MSQQFEFGDARLPQRFWEKVAPCPTSGCWLWAAGGNGDGYGQYSVGGKGKKSHRVAYETLIGPIPEGLQSDHLCRVRCCVNPAHLEPVTPRENCRRGISNESTKTHCPQGHPYSGDNLYISSSGWRYCKACGREKDKKRIEANPEKYRAKDRAKAKRLYDRNPEKQRARKRAEYAKNLAANGARSE